jgi:hypothetical protein
MSSLMILLYSGVEARGVYGVEPEKHSVSGWVWVWVFVAGGFGQYGCLDGSQVARPSVAFFLSFVWCWPGGVLAAVWWWCGGMTEEKEKEEEWLWWC